jgi:quinol monooxygenase YgiN
MVTYIVTIKSKEGHENQVADFYRGLDELLAQAPGFLGRKIYQAQTGTMVAAVKANMSEEQRAQHGEGQHEAAAGTQFILVEEWASVDDRMAFGQGASAKRMAELIPHLLPDHTHEFYREVV